MQASEHYAVVTGAGSGIGRAIAWALSQRDIPLILVGRTRESMEATQRQATSVAQIVVGDVVDSRCAQAIVSALGTHRVRWLVHAAGVMEIGRLLTLSRAKWERSFATNVHARLYLTQALRDRLVPGSRLLNIGSRSARRPRRGAAAYCASYAASVMLSECLRVELQSQQVDLLTLFPGSVATKLLQQSMLAPRDIFPDGQIYADEARDGKLIAPETVGRCATWLLLDAPASVFRQSAIEIEDTSYHGQWLRQEPLYLPAMTSPADQRLGEGNAAD